MIKKICYIDQPGGLGDILYSIKIGCYYSELGYKVVWPVYSVYKDLDKYLDTGDKIQFLDQSEEYENKSLFTYLSNTRIAEVTEIDNLLYIPIRKSFYSNKSEQYNLKGDDYKNMIGKYTMCDLSYKSWQEYFEINRNYKEENNLFNLLNIKNDYHLINREFGTPPIWREILAKEIKTPNNLQSINMTLIEGFSIFSWLNVFEKATMIDTVSTSNFYLFEKINLNCIPTIHSRNNTKRSYETNFEWMVKISNKKYIFIS